jgi:lipoprotein-releasing system ATP-binding protein
VLVPSLPMGQPSPVNRAKELLSRVGLQDRINHRPATISGGEKQRVAVVRALINKPQILLADEPTGALDRISASQLADLLIELNREENISLIVVTHSLELAKKMSKSFDLQNGKLIQIS